MLPPLQLLHARRPRGQRLSLRPRPATPLSCHRLLWQRLGGHGHDSMEAPGGRGHAMGRRPAAAVGMDQCHATSHDGGERYAVGSKHAIGRQRE